MGPEEEQAVLEESHYKMCKKIAQLTRVIGMLVNKNEEQEYEKQYLTEAFEVNPPLKPSCASPTAVFRTHRIPGENQGWERSFVEDESVEGARPPMLKAPDRIPLLDTASNRFRSPPQTLHSNRSKKNVKGGAIPR